MAPIPFSWDGDVMTPKRGFARECDLRFVIGEVYRLEVIEERSAKSHAHYFACLSEIHSNLPEDQAERFATVEHLRKFALIKCGFADERSIVAASKAEALRLAAFVKPMDDYAVVLVSECVVKVFTAQSQSLKAMGKKDFQESKQAVLEFVSSMIGVTPDALAHNAGKAA